MVNPRVPDGKVHPAISHRTSATLVTFLPGTFPASLSLTLGSIHQLAGLGFIFRVSEMDIAKVQESS